MIRQAYERLRSDGVLGFTKLVSHRLIGWPPRTIPRSKYLSKSHALFQSATGLELGGPSAVFSPDGCLPIYQLAARIDNCNFSTRTIWEGVIAEGHTFVFDPSKAPGRQFVSEASHLPFIEDATYDFVLSSHCLEHLANPLKGLHEWSRVLKVNGVLVLVLPHKERTFDHRRAVTRLEHVIADYENQTPESDMTHFDDAITLHDVSRNPGGGGYETIVEQAKRNFETRCIHHHVFDLGFAVDVVNQAGLQILAAELFEPYHIIVFARKLPPSDRPDNARIRAKAPGVRWQRRY